MDVVGTGLTALDLGMGGLILFLALRGALRGLKAELSGLAAFCAGIAAAGNPVLNSLVRQALDDFLGGAFWGGALVWIILFIVAGILAQLLLSILGRIIALKLPGRPARLFDVLGGAVAGCGKGVLLCALFLALFCRFAPDSAAAQRSSSRLFTPIYELWEKISDMPQAAPGLQRRAPGPV